MSKPKLIIVFIIILLLTILIMQNLNVITFNVLFWEIEISAFTIPIIAVVCIAIGYFLAKILGRSGKNTE